MKGNNTFLRIALIVIVIVLFFILTCFYKFAEGHITSSITSDGLVKYSDEMSVYGTLGDYFGGIVNPILGFITFTALLFTVYLQLQQSTESKKLTFENSFHKLLDLHNNIISDLSYKGGHKRLSFTKFIDEKLVFDESDELYVIHKSTNGGYLLSRAKKVYRVFNRKENAYFGHYFRSLYRILKTIEKSSLTEEDKQGYARVLRAQLSMDELAVLYINCLPFVCDKGEFQKLIIRFSMLEHLSISKLNHDQSVITNKNYRSKTYMVGNKIPTIGKDIVGYLSKDKHGRKISGAFGTNHSVALKDLVNL